MIVFEHKAIVKYPFSSDCLFVDQNIVTIVNFVAQIIPVWLGAKREGGKYKWKSGVLSSKNPKKKYGNQGYRRSNWSDFNVELLDALCRG